MSKVEQKIQYISIKDLVLWTENPRDFINEDATDQDIIERALLNSSSKWNLTKLAKEMGDYYDYSELPTVVFHGDKPIVYDGNRRIILGKIKHKHVSIPSQYPNLKIPDFPLQIPCNVCTKDIALKNVFRKHSDSGSWAPLERDIFLHRLMGEKKSNFLIIEQKTGIISQNPSLNKVFVKNEIFNKENLEKLGFFVQNEDLMSKHDEQQSRQVLSDISRKIIDKEITTRKRRGQVIDVLDPSTKKLLDGNKDRQNLISLSWKTSRDKSKNKDKKTKHNGKTSQQSVDIASQSKKTVNNEPILRQSQRTASITPELFGGKLYLRSGKTSDLYRDIVDLYDFYKNNKDTLSDTFPSLIRMSLRLLCETASKEKNFSKIDNYVKKNYLEAKKTLDQNTKTTISNQGIEKEKIMQLLHTGAHNYKSSNNIYQTIALSIIIGAILTITHGKNQAR